jgi:hypothetical protein
MRKKKINIKIKKINKFFIYLLITLTLMLLKNIIFLLLTSTTMLRNVIYSKILVSGTFTATKIRTLDTFFAAVVTFFTIFIRVFKVGIFARTRIVYRLSFSILSSRTRSTICALACTLIASFITLMTQII